VVRHLGIAESTWNRWRSQYGGMKADEAKRLRQLETENARLKKLRAEAELDKARLSWPRKLLTPERRRRAVVALTQRVGMSERRACVVTGQHRSTQRLVGRPRPSEEDELRRRLQAIARVHPRWGWKTAHSILRREGWVINRKCTQRLWRDEGLRRPPPCRRKRTRPPDGGELLRAQRPNQVWAPGLPVRRDRRSPEAEAVEHRRRAHPRGAGHAG
jgi:putative transposase